jgi:tetratricopeptide (TPR) repeat protein
MSHRILIPALLGLTALLATPATQAEDAATPDALARLPERWAERLEPVPAPDILGADPVAQETLSATRDEVALQIQDPTATPERVGKALGDLGALYHAYSIDRPAEVCYRNAIALDPEHFRWHYYAGKLALDGGRMEDALEQFRAAEQIDPAYQPLKLRMGQAYLELSLVEEARPWLLEAAKEARLRAAAQYHLGQIDLLERNYASAVDHFKEALALDPEADRIHYPLAQALRGLGDMDRAREHLARHGKREPHASDPLIEELEALESGSRPHFIAAMQASRKGNYGAALKAFRRGLALEPDNLYARVSYARAYFLDGDRDAARKELLSVLDEDPNHPLASFLLALLYEVDEREELAMERYRKIVTAKPDEAGAQFFLANLLFRAGEYAQAAEHYSAAFAVSPDAEPAGLLSLVARKRTGAADKELVGTIEQMLQEDSHRQLIRAALIRLLAASNDPEVRDPQRAVELAEILAANAPPSPPNLESMAQAQAAAGQTEQAAEGYERLIEMARWSGQWDQIERLSKAEQQVRNGKIPGPAWPDQDPMFQPMPSDPVAAFTYYPAARAY